MESSDAGSVAGMPRWWTSFTMSWSREHVLQRPTLSSKQPQLNNWWPAGPRQQYRWAVPGEFAADRAISLSRTEVDLSHWPAHPPDPPAGSA